jgi:hypothetical protein
MERAPMSDRPYRPWKVVLLVTRRMEFVVDARTPEQAEGVAEECLADGEQAQHQDAPDVQVEDVLPMEELSSDELFKSDATGHH